MTLLILGIFLWSATHLFVAMAPTQRASLVARLGEGPYKGLFSLALVIALVLIVVGWRSITPEVVYQPPVFLRHLTLLLTPLALILFLSAQMPTDIKQVLRHPQLTGLKLWAFAHLLTNGELRSLVLFGGLLAWAVLEVIFINRRDGAWQKPAPVGALKTTVSALVGLAVAVALMFAHPWFTGRAVIG